MARRTYEEIIQRKNFYRNAYRKTSMALMLSCIVMFSLVVAIYYLTIKEPDPAFYASQSAGIVTRLTPLNEPNPTSEPLLNSDPVEEMGGMREVNI